MVGVSCSEDIECAVSASVAGCIICPLDVGGNALDVGDLDASCELLAGVHVALDIVLTALPCPGSVP